MPARKSIDGVSLAPVDTPKDESAPQRTLEQTIAAEGRLFETDQIEDYHKKHPTLDASGPAHDVEVQEELRLGLAAGLKKVVKEEAKAVEAEATENS